MSDSYKPILDREGVDESMQQLRDPISLLKELADYGSALIPRAFDSSPRDHQATILIGVFLQQVVAHLDGAEVLLGKGCGLTATLQLRSLLENSMYLHWILESDTANKIDHIFVANVRRRRHGQAIGMPGSAEAIRHAAASARLTMTPEQAQGVADEVDRLGQLLADPRYAAINTKFEPHYLRRNFDEPWYKHCGQPNIRQIAIACGREQEYNYLYSPFSKTAHGSDWGQSIVFHGDQVEFKAVRRVEEIPRLAKIAATLALDVYRKILQTYRPGELDNFGHKYLIEWRSRYRQTFELQIDPQWIRI